MSQRRRSQTSKAASRTAGPSFSRWLVFALATLFLMAFILKTSFVAFVAERNPRLALDVSPTHAQALLADAKRELGRMMREAAEARAAKASTAKARAAASSVPRNANKAEAEPAGFLSLSEPERAYIKARLLASLAANARNPEALSLLGAIADEEGDEQAATSYMTKAAHYSTRDRTAHFWLMRRDIRARRFAAATRQGDILLRAHTTMLKPVTQLLTALVENPDSRQHVVKLLSGNPPWRAQFLQAMLPFIADARTPHDLFVALADTPTPVEQETRSAYLNFLVKSGFVGLAYNSWLQFLTADELARIRPVYNGDFERKPSGFVFDWTLATADGAIVDILPDPEQAGNHVLGIETNGTRVTFGGVRQLLMAAPGAYRLKGRYKMSLRGRRGFVWRLKCSDDRVLAETPMALGVSRGWSTFSIDVDIPSACVSQTLDLRLDARSTSETMILGSIFYDDVRLEAAPRSLVKAP